MIVRNWEFRTRLPSVLLAGVSVMVLFNASFAQEQPDTLSPSRFPITKSNDAWKLLPRKSPQLPEWARILVEPLPKTTAR